MTGRPGQPGRITTSPAQAAAAKRTAKAHRKAGPGGATDDTPTSVVGDDPEVERRMRQIKVPAPKTWGEAKTREQTRAEIYRTLVAASQLKQERRDLVPRRELAEVAEALRDAIARHLDQVPRLVADALDLPPATRAQLVHEVGSRIRLALAQAIAEAAKR